VPRCRGIDTTERVAEEGSVRFDGLQAAQKLADKVNVGCFAQEGDTSSHQVISNIRKD
jgi:hypothetical protein